MPTTGSSVWSVIVAHGWRGESHGTGCSTSRFGLLHLHLEREREREREREKLTNRNRGFKSKFHTHRLNKEKIKIHLYIHIVSVLSIPKVKMVCVCVNDVRDYFNLFAVDLMKLHLQDLGHIVGRLEYNKSKPLVGR